MAEDNQHNPRRFNVWEMAVLNSAMYSAADIKQKLEEICGEKQSTIDNLGPTLVSSEVLYELVSSYLSAYEALTKENLLRLGNSQKFKPQIH